MRFFGELSIELRESIPPLMFFLLWSFPRISFFFFCPVFNNGSLAEGKAGRFTLNTSRRPGCDLHKESLSDFIYPRRTFLYARALQEDGGGNTFCNQPPPHVLPNQKWLKKSRARWWFFASLGARSPAGERYLTQLYRHHPCAGPAFWGLINPEWSMCNRGRRQSPINVDPGALLFDPNLRPLHVDKHSVKEEKEREERRKCQRLLFIYGAKVSGSLSNMGQGLMFTVDNSSKPSVNLTGGPLSYKYEWHQMALHFGLNNSTGSEHTIAGRAFPAEVGDKKEKEPTHWLIMNWIVQLQVFGFNTQLYSTFSEAQDSPHGIVAISVLIQVSSRTIYLMSARHARVLLLLFLFPTARKHNDLDRVLPFLYVDWIQKSRLAGRHRSAVLGSAVV